MLKHVFKVTIAILLGITIIIPQRIPTSGATAISSLVTANGRTLLVVANAGIPGNRELNSTVFELVGEQLHMVGTLVRNIIG